MEATHARSQLCLICKKKSGDHFIFPFLNISVGSIYYEATEVSVFHDIGQTPLNLLKGITVAYGYIQTNIRMK